MCWMMSLLPSLVLVVSPFAQSPSYDLQWCTCGDPPSVCFESITCKLIPPWTRDHLSDKLLFIDRKDSMQPRVNIFFKLIPNFKSFKKSFQWTCRFKNV
mmetsp:Transcript_103283/g.166498  ORF Transcript_103283/g.166498 Transcript_103283/m.166498 type:complete len:99 (+) Transcript_103283:50-346(+)